MKRAIFYIPFLILLASCAPEVKPVEDEPRPEGPAYEVSMLEADLLSDPSFGLCWLTGDQISVFRYSDWNERYQFKGQDGNTYGKFKPVSAAASACESGKAEFSCAYGIFPWSPKTTCVSDGVFKVYYNDSQDFSSPVMSEGLSTMVAATSSKDDTEMVFRNASGYLKLSIYGIAQIKSITVKGKDGEKIGGFANITIKNDGDPEIEMCSDALDAVTLNVGGLVISAEKATPTDFYLALPPTSFKKGISIDIVLTGGDSYVKEIETPVEVTRGKITAIDKFEYFGLIGEINGTPIYSGNTIAGLITDKSGKALPGIPVSDGYDIVVTDENGVYQIRANDLSRYVYFICPAEYEVPVDSKHYPAFYSLDITDGKLSRNDFVLTPKTRDETNWTLVGIADPQVMTQADISRYRNETVPDIKKYLDDHKCKNCYALVLGDLVSAAPFLFPNVKEFLSDFQIYDGTYLPHFVTPGNHDHYKSGAKSQYESLSDYVKYFGPIDYSFNIGNAHIVSMDTHIADNWTGDGGGSYTCGFTDEQWEWFKKDLALVENKAEKQIILFTHAAFGDQDNHANYVMPIHHKDDVLKALTDFHDANLLSGHTHYWRNFVFENYVCKSGRPIYEHNQGAACGFLWVTDNLNPDGSPNGYCVYDVRGTEFYDWAAKFTNQPDEYQMRVYNGNQIYQSQGGANFCWYSDSKNTNSSAKGFTHAEFENSFVISLWDDDRSYWTVEFYIDGVKQGNATRIKGIAADFCANAFFPQTKQGTCLFNQAKYCDHYWYFKAPGNDPASVTNWEVRATQTIPASGVKHVYTCNTLQTDFTGFAVN